MPRGKPNPKPSTLPMPPDWRDHFKGATMRTNFVLSMSRAMLEFLCAVSDDVHWDRARFGDMSCPDNWISTETSLKKRGLIVRKTREEMDAESDRKLDLHYYQGPANCKLTPAGELIVQLVKITGLFIEADAAIEKKHKRA